MKHLSDKETHAVNISKLFKKLEYVNNYLYEVQLAKAQKEHKEPTIVGFLILQCTKLRILKLYYNFITEFCSVHKFKELEMDTDSLYLVPAEKELEDCIRSQLRPDCQRLRSNDCVDSFTADAVANFFPEHVVYNTNNMIRESLVSSKKSSDVRRCCICVVRHSVAIMLPLINLNLEVTVSTNVYWNRAATDHWKSIVES